MAGYHYVMGRVARDPLARYQEKVDVREPDECWPWTAAVFDNGYGAFRLGDRQTKAHRTGYELLVGPISEGLYVCHTCDNRLCQNPRHWFLGTHGDNARDREQKGRGRGRENLPVVHLFGSTNGQAKLTEDDVREMRRLRAEEGWRLLDLADRFQTTKPNVSMIVNRRTWVHVV